MSRRGLICPQCQRQLTYAKVRLGRCPFCETTVCIPKHYLRLAALVGNGAVLVFVIKTYRIMLAPSPSTFTNFVLFMLWFVIMFAILLSVTHLSSFIQVWLFPPTVKRARMEFL
jgi:hypothetical protein